MPSRDCQVLLACDPGVTGVLHLGGLPLQPWPLCGADSPGRSLIPAELPALRPCSSCTWYTVGAHYMLKQIGPCHP